MREHVQRGAGFLQPSPYLEGQEPWIGNESLREVYDINSPLILQCHQEGPVNSTYNVPLTNDFSSFELMEAMQDIYDRQQHAFRLNLQFGLILVNTETGEYRYFRPFSNESLFQRPIYVSRRQDLNKLRKRLDRFNVLDYILQQRPNTKWKPVLVTNVHFSLFHLNYTLGAPLDLPDYIKTSKSIVSLDKRSNGKPYEDNLCGFRCLATHHHGRDRIDTHTKFYFEQWINYVNGKEDIEHIDRDKFTGITLDHVADFEKCFSINVNVYDLQEDGSAFSVYKSRCHHKDTMFLNLFEHHLSYISNIRAYASKYQCRTCERHFTRINDMQRHQRICKGLTEHRFPGGFYTTPKTIFDKLEENGIHIPKQKRLFPWFIVYDFEAMLIPIQGEGSDKLAWTAKHVPISVSISSNVDG